MKINQILHLKSSPRLEERDSVLSAYYRYQQLKVTTAPPLSILLQCIAGFGCYMYSRERERLLKATALHSFHSSRLVQPYRVLCAQSSGEVPCLLFSGTKDTLKNGTPPLLAVHNTLYGYTNREEWKESIPVAFNSRSRSLLYQQHPDPAIDYSKMLKGGAVVTVSCCYRQYTVDHNLCYPPWGKLGYPQGSCYTSY